VPADGGRRRISTAASAMISGVRELAAAAGPPSRFMTTAVAIRVCGHKQLAATPASAYSAAQPRVSSVMAYLDWV
jgi:hypothetical protein